MASSPEGLYRSRVGGEGRGGSRREGEVVLDERLLRAQALLGGVRKLNEKVGLIREVGLGLVVLIEGNDGGGVEDFNLYAGDRVMEDREDGLAGGGEVGEGADACADVGGERLKAEGC